MGNSLVWEQLLGQPGKSSKNTGEKLSTICNSWELATVEMSGFHHWWCPFNYKIWFLGFLNEMKQSWSQNVDVPNPVGKVEEQKGQWEHSSEIWLK